MTRDRDRALKTKNDVLLEPAPEENLTSALTHADGAGPVLRLICRSAQENDADSRCRRFPADTMNVVFHGTGARGVGTRLFSPADPRCANPKESQVMGFSFWGPETGGGREVSNLSRVPYCPRRQFPPASGISNREGNTSTWEGVFAGPASLFDGPLLAATERRQPGGLCSHRPCEGGRAVRRSVFP